MSTVQYMPVVIANLFATMLAAVLCVVVVRDRLRRPLWQVLGMLFVPSVALSVVDAGLYGLLAAPAAQVADDILLAVYLCFCCLYCRRSVDVQLAKLLFIMMIVFSLFCFLVAFSDAWRIPSDYSLLLFYAAVMCPLAIPSYFVLRRVLWPIIRDIQSDTWRLLWVIPMLYGVVIIAMNGALSSASMQVHIALLLLLLGSAFVTYVVLGIMIRQTAEQAKQAERAAAAAGYLSLQQGHYRQLMAHMEQTRVLRHDFRHQLLVLRQYAQERNPDAFVAYCDTIEAMVPRASGLVLCDHFAANAVAVHYLSLAKEAGVRVDAQLEVPQDMGLISDGELCVLIGNLLENALEACLRMAESDRFIRVRTRLSAGTWTIGVDNSFSGESRMHDGQFLSSKRADVGIGTASIRAAARRYRGDAEFREAGGVFYASVYLVIR